MSKDLGCMPEAGSLRSAYPPRELDFVFSRPADEDGALAPRPVISDPALTLVRTVFMSPAQECPRMVVFAGVEHGTGCSHMAVAIAQALATQALGTVCLVDANLRSPALHRLLKVESRRGLTQALVQSGPIESFVEPVPASRLSVLTAGDVASGSPNLLTSPRLAARLAELRREFDFVLLDAPPLTRYGDAAALGQMADGLVLVIEAESTRRQAATTVVEGLRASQVKLLAAVLNKRSFPIPERLYRKL